MIDHLYSFASEAEAKALFGAPGELPHGIATMIYIDGVRCDILPVDLVTQDAAYAEDGETLLVSRETVPGYWCIARYNGKVTLPGAPRLVTDSELAAAGEPYVLSAAADLDMTIVQSVLRIEPTFAGDNYPFISGLGPDSFV